jgi:WhiB family redox-sensing transcriptional regulator
MASRWNWRSASRCRTSDAEDLFVTGRKQREARQFCRVCPVRTECLAHALDQRIEFGIWGGMTERERRALLRRRPDVTSWADLLADARAAHDASMAALTGVDVDPATMPTAWSDGKAVMAEPHLDRTA